MTWTIKFSSITSSRKYDHNFLVYGHQTYFEEIGLIENQIIEAGAILQHKETKET